MEKGKVGILAFLSAMIDEAIRLAPRGLVDRGGQYYTRFMGKSRTFKKNRRKGL